jgi:hypothetical protein
LNRIIQYGRGDHAGVSRVLRSIRAPLSTSGLQERFLRDEYLEFELQSRIKTRVDVDERCRMEFRDLVGDSAPYRG